MPQVRPSIATASDAAVAAALSRRRALYRTFSDGSDDEDEDDIGTSSSSRRRATSAAPKEASASVSAKDAVLYAPKPIETPPLESMSLMALVKECIRRGIDNSGTEGEMRQRLSRARALV